MGSMLGPRDSEKLYADIIFQKLRNDRGIIRISAHPEAENPEEQHLNAQHAHTKFMLACAGCSLNYGDQKLDLT
jgi:hypothetical protein